MSVTYRNFRPSDLDGQRELFRLGFPEAIGTPAESLEHYHWKFRSYPAAPPSFEYVGESDGNLVAYYAAVPFSYRLRGRTVTAGMVCDVMTHPAMRGKGLFTGIGRHATAAMATGGLAFVTGYPIRPEVVPGHLKVGWKIVQKLPVWLRPVGTRSLLPPRLKVAARVLDPLLRAMLAWMRPARGYRVEIIGREAFLDSVVDTAEYRRLLDCWIASVPNALEKNSAFLRWRTGAPATDYRFALLYRGSLLVGLAVVRNASLKGIDCLAVLDLMVDPEHRSGARSLHHALSRMARSEGRDALACMCSREWARAYRFAASGYLRTPAVFSLIVKKLDEAIADADVYDEHRWHVFWLDSDDL